MSNSSIYTNPRARTWTHTYDTDIGLAQAFHKRLPGYKETPLVPLGDLAKDLNLKGIFVKDESSRLGLPSFKILGASWGTFRAIAENHGLELDSTLKDVSEAAKKSETILFAATEGNHGRAVARMGKILGIPVQIFMSKFADCETCQKIESEGAEVTVISGNYDDAVSMAFQESQKAPSGLLIQDNAFDGYEQIPPWIVEGYSTLLAEVEQQLRAQKMEATVIVTPIGVGSLGHSVAAFCKSNDRQIRVVAVEPETAACLHENLKSSKWRTIETSATVMNGMNCGTVSPISWPILSEAVDVSITITDLECHESVQYLQAHGINAGPCGAAALAAIRKVDCTDSLLAGLWKDAVIVLLSTEGSRPYIPPSMAS